MSECTSSVRSIIRNNNNKGNAAMANNASLSHALIYGNYLCQYLLRRSSPPKCFHNDEMELLSGLVVGDFIHRAYIADVLLSQMITRV